MIQTFLEKINLLHSEAKGSSLCEDEISLNEARRFERFLTGHLTPRWRNIGSLGENMSSLRETRWLSPLGWADNQLVVQKYKLAKAS